MEIGIYHLLEGARQADGLTVIIDVFRAFSLECYLYAMGAREIRPVGRIEEAFAWKNEDPDCLLAGERGGKMCEGFDFGNSPSAAEKIDVRGKRIIHTTSAGTQGIVNAVHAEEIIGGALVNARAVAAYIKRRNPEKVSLVCMGNGGVRPAAEDELCAEYIRALLLGEEIPEHFFDPERQEIFPEADFWRCIEYDRFDFVVRIERDERGLVARMMDPLDEADYCAAVGAERMSHEEVFSEIRRQIHGKEDK